MTEAQDNRRWLALAVIVTAQFMVVLDISIVNVALPSIKTDLHFSQESLQWVITAYSIFFGGFLLLGGRLADLFGRRRLFMAGLLLFTVSSLLDGLAWSEGSLIAFRGLQGLGAAMMSPAALSILTTTFAEGRERNRALGIWGAVAGSGGAVGVLLGGILTSAFSWPWIFFVNVPVGVAVLAVSPSLLRESRADLPDRYFDFAGAATITGGLMLLVYGMTHATQHGWAHIRDHRSPGSLRRLDRLVLPDRVAREGAPPAAPHLPAADARRIEPERPDRDRRRLLAVLPAHAVHAAGPALLGAQDRGRLHRADADDHRLLGRLAGPRDKARSQERAARRAGCSRPSRSCSSRNCRCTATTSATCSRASSSAASGWPSSSSRCRSARSPGPPGGCGNRLRADQHEPADRRGDRRRGCHDDRDDVHGPLRELPCRDHCFQRRGADHGFQVAFYVLAATALVGAVVARLLIESQPSAAEGEPKRRASGRRCVAVHAALS